MRQECPKISVLRGTDHPLTGGITRRSVNETQPALHPARSGTTPRRPRQADTVEPAPPAGRELF